MDSILRNQMAAYLRGEMTLRGFRHWFAKISMDQTESRSAMSLLRDLSDMDQGFTTEAQLQRTMSLMLIPYLPFSESSNTMTYIELEAK